MLCQFIDLVYLYIIASGDRSSPRGVTVVSLMVSIHRGVFFVAGVLFFSAEGLINLGVGVGYRLNVLSVLSLRRYFFLFLVSGGFIDLMVDVVGYRCRYGSH